MDVLLLSFVDSLNMIQGFPIQGCMERVWLFDMNVQDAAFGRSLNCNDISNTSVNMSQIRPPASSYHLQDTQGAWPQSAGKAYRF